MKKSLLIITTLLAIPSAQGMAFARNVFTRTALNTATKAKKHVSNATRQWNSIFNKQTLKQLKPRPWLAAGLMASGILIPTVCHAAGETFAELQPDALEIFNRHTDGERPQKEFGRTLLGKATHNPAFRQQLIAKLIDSIDTQDYAQFKTMLNAFCYLLPVDYSPGKEVGQSTPGITSHELGQALAAIDLKDEQKRHFVREAVHVLSRPFHETIKYVAQSETMGTHAHELEDDFLKIFQMHRPFMVDNGTTVIRRLSLHDKETPFFEHSKQFIHAHKTTADEKIIKNVLYDLESTLYKNSHSQNQHFCFVAQDKTTQEIVGALIVTQDRDNTSWLNPRDTEYTIQRPMVKDNDTNLQDTLVNAAATFIPYNETLAVTASTPDVARQYEQRGFTPHHRYTDGLLLMECSREASKKYTTDRINASATHVRISSSHNEQEYPDAQKLLIQEMPEYHTEIAQSFTKIKKFGHDNNPYACFVAKNMQGETIGCAIVCNKNLLHKQMPAGTIGSMQGALTGYGQLDGMHIEYLAVAKHAQGQHVGTQLIDEVMQRNKLATSMTVHAVSKAIPFYMARGFLDFNGLKLTKPQKELTSVIETMRKQQKHEPYQFPFATDRIMGLIDLNMLHKQA